MRESEEERNVGLKGGNGKLSREGSSLRDAVKTITHYAGLIVAKHPLESHRQYLENSNQEILSTNSLKSKWQSTFKKIIIERDIEKNYEIIKNKEKGNIERFIAIVNLKYAVHKYPDKKQLIWALRRKQENNYTGIFDRIKNELFITGELIFIFFTPSPTGKHKMFFTLVMLISFLMVFFFMAGEFYLYMFHNHHDQYHYCTYHHSNNNFHSIIGPFHLINWIIGKNEDTWCFPEIKPWSFSTDFLIKWGARYGPLVSQPGNTHRWFTSIFLHEDTKHLYSNSLLFFGLSWHIEVKYGWWRILILFLFSHAGGALFSATFEDPCAVVFGASGAVFGLIGLFIADLSMNFPSIKRPILRCIFILFVFLNFTLTLITSDTVSHWSHIGGLLCGLFPSFMFLPRLNNEKMESLFPFVGGLITVTVFSILPPYLYASVFTDLRC